MVATLSWLGFTLLVPGIIVAHLLTQWPALLTTLAAICITLGAWNIAGTVFVVLLARHGYSISRFVPEQLSTPRALVSWAAAAFSLGALVALGHPILAALYGFGVIAPSLLYGFTARTFASR